MTDKQIDQHIAELTNCAGHGNYCDDLNAMHEAEKMLTTDQFYAYSAWIDKLTPKHEYRAYLGATSRQRAEAFLRMFGKWEEAE